MLFERTSVTLLRYVSVSVRRSESALTRSKSLFQVRPPLAGRLNVRNILRWSMNPTTASCEASIRNRSKLVQLSIIHRGRNDESFDKETSVFVSLMFKISNFNDKLIIYALKILEYADFERNSEIFPSRFSLSVWISDAEAWYLRPSFIDVSMVTKSNRIHHNDFSVVLFQTFSDHKNFVGEWTSEKLSVTFFKSSIFLSWMSRSRTYDRLVIKRSNASWHIAPRKTSWTSRTLPYVILLKNLVCSISDKL